MNVGWQPRIPVFLTGLDLLPWGIPVMLRDIDFAHRKVEPRPMLWLVWDEEE